MLSASRKAAGALTMPRSAALFLLSAAGILGLAGCLHRGGESAPPVAVPQAFSAGGEAEAPERWWTAFGDGELDRLVATALADNLDLRAAYERLRAARAVTRRERSGLFPELDATADAEARRSEFVDDEGLTAGFSASYEVDLWGRVRATADAAEFRAEATRADYEAAALSLSGEVARTWYALVEARRQAEVLREQIESNRQVLELLENRFGSGQVRGVDLLRQEQLVESTREQLAVVRADLETLEHGLSVLLGSPPGPAVGAEDARLPRLPPLPETGAPAELVRRRPDLAAARERLRAADRELAAAVSNRYPRVNLTGSLTTATEDPSDFLRDWLGTAAGDVVAPLLDGGERRAEVDRTEAVRRQRLLEYGQTVLEAFREVEDALARERRQAERVRRLREQLDLARRAYEQLRVEYLNGVSDYIDVLTALTEQQELRRELLRERRRRVVFRIDLYRALAGPIPESGGESRDRSGDGNRSAANVSQEAQS